MRLHIISLFLFSLIALSACGKAKQATTNDTTTAHSKQAQQSPAEVNIYSYREEALIKPLLDQFSAKSNIKVNLVTGKAEALLERLKSEGKNTPADVILTSDAGRLYQAKKADVLQAIDSKELEQNIPAHLRDQDKQWFALSQRGRIIFFNKDKVTKESLSTYEDLATPKWKGKICVRSSDSIYNQSLLASIISNADKDAALYWAKGIVANLARKPKGNDRDQLQDVALGVCDLTLANTYYFGAWQTSKDSKILEHTKKIGVFFPNQKDRGAHMNISGAGVTKYAKNKENAVKLLEFLSSVEAQNYYAETNQEYPVNTKATVSNLLKSWGYPFKMDAINVEDFGIYNKEAIKIFDVAGWE